MHAERIDYLQIATLEALSRLARPSAGQWVVAGTAALRLAFGAPLQSRSLSIHVRPDAELGAVLRAARARVESRLLARYGATVELHVVEEGDLPRVRLQLVEGGAGDAGESDWIEVALTAQRPNEAADPRSLEAPSLPGFRLVAPTRCPEGLLDDALDVLSERPDEAALQDAAWLVGDSPWTFEPAHADRRDRAVIEHIEQTVTRDRRLARAAHTVLAYLCVAEPAKRAGGGPTL